MYRAMILLRTLLYVREAVAVKAVSVEQATDKAERIMLWLLKLKEYE